MRVNLLRCNPTGVSLIGRTDEPSSPEAEDAFMDELKAQRVVAHLRRSRGQDIDAACSQLRRRAESG
jgi:23S rRNA (adenine2503-C2)-methyltransferase